MSNWISFCIALITAVFPGGIEVIRPTARGLVETALFASAKIVIPSTTELVPAMGEMACILPFKRDGVKSARRSCRTGA